MATSGSLNQDAGLFHLTHGELVERSLGPCSVPAARRPRFFRSRARRDVARLLGGQGGLLFHRSGEVRESYVAVNGAQMGG